MKSLIIGLFFLLLGVQTQASCKKGEDFLYLNMPLIIGDTIFNDQVEICKSKGKLNGKLTVPKRFTAQLENIKLNGKKLSFSITANEGRGPFTVNYIGEFKEDGRFFMGIAKLKSGSLLGPFIGVKTKAAQKFKVIQ